MSIELGTIFLIGFLSSFGHCIGMCGGFVVGYTLKLNQLNSNGNNLTLPHLLYNFGRITTYIFLGFVFGAIGETLTVSEGLSRFQGILQLSAGIIMIWMALDLGGWIPRLSQNYFPGYQAFKSIVSRMLHRLNVKNIFGLGLLLGFIPCGLVYAAGAKAAATQGVLSGMLTMAVFGLGTMPALLIVGLGAQFISARTRQWLFRLATILVILLGLVTFYRGYFVLTDHALAGATLHNLICHP